MPAPGYGTTAYQRHQVDGSDRERLVVLLTRALIKFLVRARAAIEKGDCEGKASALDRARAILSELHCSLDEDAGGELARNLRGLYAHWHSELVQADLDDDLEALDYVISCAQDLAEAWQEAYKACRDQQHGQVA